MKTIIELFETSVAKFPNNVYLWEKKNGKYEGTTYQQTHDLVMRFAAGLIKLGIQKGDRVALIAEGRNAWIISELGVLYSGGINVPLSVRLESGNELKFRLTHSGCKMVMVSKGHASKIEDIRNELPDLEKVIYLDGKENPGTNDISYNEVLTLGDEYLKTNRDEFDAVYQTIGPDDIAKYIIHFRNNCRSERNYAFAVKLRCKCGSGKHVARHYPRMENTGISALGSFVCPTQPASIASCITELVLHRLKLEKLPWKP